MRQNAYVSNFWRRIRRGAPKLTSKFPSIEKALKRVQHSAITSLLVELEDHMFILSALTAARGGIRPGLPTLRLLSHGIVAHGTRRPAFLHYN